MGSQIPLNKSGIYIHIPYCRKKCLYCDFYTGGERIAVWDKYVDALLSEFKIRYPELQTRPSTLYIGGGTPSLMPVNDLKRLLKGLRDLSGNERWEEFTLEVNPENVNEENVSIWKQEGVNRLSIGIQSLSDVELTALGRSHDSKVALDGLDLIKKNFDNFSVDLMYGLPYQTEESYKETLAKVLRFEPLHISVYSLMLESGTALTLLHKQGKIKLPDEDAILRMFEFTCKILKASGYRRYEISNYALPGYESKHNSLYWLGNEYLGIGAGAHSYNGENIRKWNPNDIKSYINYYTSCDLTEKGPFFEKELLTDEEKMEEMIMTRMRLYNGLDLTEFEKKFGEDVKKILLEKSESFIRNELIKKENGHIFFTDKGIMISDRILAQIIF